MTGPDDRAVLCDVRTAWVIAGLAHGHDDLDRPEAATTVLSRDGDNIVANAAGSARLSSVPATSSRNWTAVYSASSGVKIARSRFAGIVSNWERLKRS